MKVLKKVVAAARLLLVFTIEFVTSNLSVAYMILFVKNRDLHPKLVRFDARGLSLKEMVVLSQMITLTPGTITVEVKEKEKTLMIHVLEGTAADEKIKEIKEKLEKALLGVTR